MERLLLLATILAGFLPSWSVCEQTCPEDYTVDILLTPYSFGKGQKLQNLNIQTSMVTLYTTYPILQSRKPEEHQYNLYSSSCNDLSISSFEVLCDINGTPTEVKDDRFYFTLIVERSNDSAKGWVSNDVSQPSGKYGESITFGPYNIADGEVNVTISDQDDPKCHITLGIPAPPACSDVCDIEAGLSNLTCMDNGTPEDPLDDTFTFDVIVSGYNTATTGWYQIFPNGTLGGTGQYEEVVTFGPYNISDGPVDILIRDNLDSKCQVELTAVPPTHCSDPCEIASITEAIILEGDSIDWNGTTYFESGNFAMTLEAAAVNGCDSIARLDLTVLPKQHAAEVCSRAQITVTPTCYNSTTGTIEVNAIEGGMAPYLISVNNHPLSTDSVFTNLWAGNHLVTVQDLDGCEWDTLITIVEQAPVEVLITAETNELELGDSVRLRGQTTIPADFVDSLYWTPEDQLSCSNCYEPWAQPFKTSNYTLTAIDAIGCKGSTFISLTVDQRVGVYTPDAFSPNGDGVNDTFTIYGGTNLYEIEELRIFDRRRNIVYQQENFPPNDPFYGWDGVSRGQLMNSAVFVYWTRVRLVDGTTRIFKGDLTLVR